MAYKPDFNGLVNERIIRELIYIESLLKYKAVHCKLVFDDFQVTIKGSLNEAVGKIPHYLFYETIAYWIFLFLKDKLITTRITLHVGLLNLVI